VRRGLAIDVHPRFQLFDAAGAIGASVVAAWLFGHAAWDAYHHRSHKVVDRSMAEFCCVLDTAIAVAIVMAILRA
jgi:hypothetical protein